MNCWRNLTIWQGVLPPPLLVPFSCLQYSSSCWTPPAGFLPSNNLFVSHCQRYLDCPDFSIPLSHSNLTPLDHSLHSSPKPVMKPADQCGSVVVWQTNLHHAEARPQHSGTSSHLPHSMAPPMNTRELFPKKKHHRSYHFQQSPLYSLQSS